MPALEKVSEGEGERDEIDKQTVLTVLYFCRKNIEEALVEFFHQAHTHTYILLATLYTVLCTLAHGQSIQANTGGNSMQCNAKREPGCLQ